MPRKNMTFVTKGEAPCTPAQYNGRRHRMTEFLLAVIKGQAAVIGLAKELIERLEEEAEADRFVIGLLTDWIAEILDSCP